jgi:hypothetical protein
VIFEIIVGVNLFIYGLFKDAVSCSDYKESKGTLLVNDELEKIQKEVVVAYFDYYSDIWLKGLRKTTKNVITADR